MGPEARVAMGALARVLGDRDAKVRSEAAHVLEQMKPDPGEIDAALAQVLRGADRLGRGDLSRRRRLPPTTRPSLEKRLALARRLPLNDSWSETGVFLYPPRWSWGVIPPERIQRAWEFAAQASPSGMGPDRFGLYVHVPAELGRPGAEIPRRISRLYLRCLQTEAELLGLPQGLAFRTLYLGSGGSGTLSLLPIGVLERMFQWLRGRFHLEHLRQVVAEADPLHLTSEKATLLAEQGTDRLTMKLPWLGDPATASRSSNHFKRAFMACRASGIRHIDIELVAGLEGPDPAASARAFELIARMKPDSVHVRLWQAHLAGRSEWMRLADKRLGPRALQLLEEKRGSGNLQLRHSSERSGSVLGLGFGAVGHIRARLAYAKGGSLAGYLKSLSQGHLPQFVGISMSPTREMRAHIIRSLEEVGRIELGAFQQAFGRDPEAIFSQEIEWLLERGFLERREGLLQIPAVHRREAAALSHLFYEPDVLRRCAEMTGMA